MTDLIPEMHDDIVPSIIKHMKAQSVTVKDITGASKFVTGTLESIFAGIKIEPRDIKDMEAFSVPWIGLNLIDDYEGEVYFGSAETDYIIEVVADCTYKVSGKPNALLSEANRLRMFTALRRILGGRKVIDCYSFSYSSEAPAANGKLVLRDWTAIKTEDFTLQGVIRVSGAPQET